MAETGVVRATLANGLRVVVVPNRLAPVVATELTYLVGSNDAPPGFPGTAHALEHMMFRGSPGLDRDQLADISARLGGSYNATTSETVTTYTYTVPAADLGLVLRIEALRMRDLSLHDADWAQERGAIEQEVARAESNPLFAFRERMRASLFDGTPYAVSALGSRPSFERTDITMLRDFYRRWYAPNNAVLVIVGDVDPAAAVTEAERAFADIPRRDVPAHASVEPRPVRPATLRYPTSAATGLVVLGYRFPGLKAADFAVADILGDVLGSQRGALYALVPAGRALTARFSYRVMPDVGMGLVYASFPDGGDPTELLAELTRVIAGVRRDGVPTALVEAAKRQELARLASGNASIPGLASRWTEAVTQADIASPDILATAYAAVTVEDVNRLARRLLDPGQAITAILTPSRVGQAPGNADLGAAESFHHPPERPVALPDWAEVALARLPVPAASATPDVTVLTNGLRLIVQPMPGSGTVIVAGRVWQEPDMLEPPGKEGVSMLVGRLFEYGTKRLDRVALREAIDALAASESAGSSLYLRIVPSQFEAGMRLLAEHQLQPAFPETALEVTRAQLAQGLAGLTHTPGYQYQRAIQRAIVPPGDPSLRHATAETMRGLTLDDVRAYHAAAYRPDVTTIVVVGDVTTAEARRVVREAFGEWTAEGARPPTDLPQVALNGAAEVYVADPDRRQQTVTMVQQIALLAGDPNRDALLLGNAILGDGFSSRLYRDLRVTSGYVYGVDSDLNWDRNRTQYVVRFGADAGNVDKARAMVLRNMRDMQSAPVTPEELNRAKGMILRELPMRRASLAGLAQIYLYRDGIGLPQLNDAEVARRYLAVTAADIQRVFAAVLRPDDLATVVRGAPR
ncbi:MAG: M16 family metallopeptidase [Acetobacteraceae bacterium]